MRIRLAVPDRHVNAETLDAALEATTRANDAMLAAGERPTFDEMLRSGVKWKPENFVDGEHFDIGATVAERGWGDCDDLAPILASDMRAAGDGDAHAFVARTGAKRWHALVRDGAGQVHDPSLMAGMRKAKGVRGAVSGQICGVGQRGLVVLPHAGGWAARADLPWDHTHLSSVAWNPYADAALAQAVHGACVVGDGIGLDTHEASLVGDLFGNILSTALPIAGGAMGGPLGAMAGSAASGLLGNLMGGGGGGGAPPPAPVPGTPLVQQAIPAGNGLSSPGTLAWNPHSPGPIIVRF